MWLMSRKSALLTQDRHDNSKFTHSLHVFVYRTCNLFFCPSSFSTLPSVSSHSLIESLISPLLNQLSIWFYPASFIVSPFVCPALTRSRLYFAPFSCSLSLLLLLQVSRTPTFCDTSVRHRDRFFSPPMWREEVRYITFCAHCYVQRVRRALEFVIYFLFCVTFFRATRSTVRARACE